MERGLFLTFVVLVFVLFLSLINAVFNLQGTLLRAEVWLVILFLIYAFILFAAFGRGRGVWCAAFVFFVLNIVNIVALYARTLYLSDLILPIVVSLIGLYMSAFKIEKDECCAEPECECKEEAEEVTEEKVKKGRKKK